MHGIISSLLTKYISNTANNFTNSWILIPIEDPDGEAASTFDHLTNRFSQADGNPPKEVFLYTRYLSDYINTGRSLDIAISLHNTEANENKQLFCPFIDRLICNDVVKINRTLEESLKRDAYIVDDLTKPWDYGLVSSRLYGWCAFHFGSLDFSYELNDRYPGARLSLGRLQRMGQHFVDVFSAFEASESGQQIHAKILQKLSDRQEKRSAYFTRWHQNPDTRTDTQILTLGY